jgi:hypothetical protein
MARTGEFGIAQPYPARPRWAGDFHRIEASLFSNGRVAESRADDFADAFLPGRLQNRRSAAPITDRYLMIQLPDMPSVQIDMGLVDDLR